MIHRKSLVEAVVVVLVVVAATAVQPAAAHMAFRCPEPQSPDEGLKTNPCGGYKSTDPVTTLSPGPMTVVWEEVVNHIGTPFRIQLVVFGSDGETVLERYTLRDHIPHNDDPFDEDPKYYFFNIDIPDIECIPGSSVCRLQIINPMTDKTTNGCGDADSDDPDCFSVYHSCANVAITGSNEISEYEHVYSPPDGWRNPTPNWWSKDETGVWNNGWLAGEMLANWQHDVCDTALFGSVVPKYPLTRPPVTTNPGSPTTGGAGTTTGDGLGGAHGQTLITAADDGNGLVVVVYLLTAVLVGVGAITIHRLLRKLDARDVAL